MSFTAPAETQQHIVKVMGDTGASRGMLGSNGEELGDDIIAAVASSTAHSKQRRGSFSSRLSGMISYIAEMTV